jgi:hypothetical protein
LALQSDIVALVHARSKAAEAQPLQKGEGVMALAAGYTEIKTIRNSAGTRALVIFKRPDGLFGYIGERLTMDEGDTFWDPVDISGIYESAEDAEREALAEIDWLRGPDPLP